MKQSRKFATVCTEIFTEFVFDYVQNHKFKDFKITLKITILDKFVDEGDWAKGMF